MRKSGWVTVLLLSISAVTLAEEERPAENGDKNPPFRVAGIVVSEAGEPVAGAPVDALYDGDKTSTRADEAGRFALDLPRKPLWTLLLRAVAPDGVAQACGAFAVGESSRSQLERFLPRVESLPDQAKLVLRPLRKIDAAVVDDNKRPVDGARLIVQATWYDKIAEAISDAAGRATLLVPVDAPLSSVAARKGGVGFDYFLYQNFADDKPDHYRLLRDDPKPLTFVLNGARRITVKVVDGEGQPLPEAKISSFALEKPRKGRDRLPNENHFNGGALYSGAADLSAASNAEGLATFDFWPVDSTGASFHASAWGYMGFENAFVPAGSEDAEATVKLFRTFPLGARLVYADGRPAAGVWVYVYQEPLDKGGDSGPGAAHSYSMTADQQGRLTLAVYPNHFLLLMTLTTSQKEWSAPLTTRIVHNEPPDPLEVVLEKATRVHGRLTAGLNEQRISKQQIGISRHVEDAYRELAQRGLALKPRARGNVPDVGVRLLGHQSITTNSEGDFEVFLGRGKYQFRYGDETTIEVQVDGEAEREVNFHAERPAQVDLVGRVIYQGREQKGVANARVAGYYLPKERRYPRIQTTTDAKGAFRLARRPFELLLYARDENGLFAKIIRAAADDQTAVISLSKAASAHGRLIDSETGEPVPNGQVAFGIPWKGPTECGGDVQTDEQGQFDVAGLVPGQKYRFTFYAHGRPQDHFTAFTPSDPESYALGEYRVDVSGKGLRTATGLVAPKDAPAVFHLDDDDVDGRIAAAQQQAKAENKWVLLLFGADWSAWSHRLNTFLHDNAEVAAALQESFVVILVDEQNLGDGSRKDALAKRFLHSQSRLPVLVVLDADGNQVASASELENGDDHYDSAKVLEFLEQAKHAPAVPLRGRPFGRRRGGQP